MTPLTLSTCYIFPELRIGNLPCFNLIREQPRLRRGANEEADETNKEAPREWPRAQARSASLQADRCKRVVKNLKRPGKRCTEKMPGTNEEDF